MWVSMLKYLAWVGQLGLSLVLPPVLAMWGAGWLCARFALGAWLYAVALALGIGCSVWNLMRFLRMIQRETERSEDGKHGQ